jgi:hypothetical protein
MDTTPLSVCFDYNLCSLKARVRGEYLGVSMEPFGGASEQG